MVVVGFADLLDLGYITFYALGAYSFALLASPHLPSQFETIAASVPEGMHFHLGGLRFSLSFWLLYLVLF